MFPCRCKQLVLATLPISFCFRKLKHDEVFSFMSFPTCCLDVFRNQQQKYKGIRHPYRFQAFQHIVPPEAPDDAKVQEKPSVLGCLKISAKKIDPD